MVLRRYTPPTCTLEITAKTSPLSRWAGKPVLKSLRFELRLDDPRLPEERHVTLKGDRAQLEALHEVVSTYVQDFLSQPPTVDLRLKSATTETIAETDSESLAAPTLTLDEDRNPFETGASTVDSKTPYPVNTSPLLTAHPRLQARGLLAHELFLGQLAEDTSRIAIELSALQLFDIATALDEYAAELLALPNFKRSGESKASTPWLRSAAVVLLTVGLTTGAIKLLDRSGLNEQTAIKPSSPTPSAIASRIYPSPTQAVPPPPALATPPLPPAPPPGSILPSPLPQAIVTPTPPTPVQPNPVQPPPLLFPQSPTAAPPSTPERIVTIPGDISRQAPVSQEEPIARAPKRVPIVQNPIPVPESNAPSSSGLPTLPNPSTLNRIPSTLTGETELPPLADAPSPVDPQNNTQAAAPNSNRTLFDTIPQVTEARTYFEQNWTPPEGLKETLEYSLQLDANGSIQRIVPRGKAAGDYIDRTNMPLVGEPFVSAVQDGKTPRIRLVLRPNGKVQTFLESVN
ncbi:DUF4335 domain-containing protein [Kamptonema sp. UHCC 0994]|uniref:DUF4335 domain-containing protein n=1 Tax=Kamptonema sp. UHCC 0994 TaxID=3031329 RepID=UPI0023B98FF3|nr:DUF4335 domain-containing protein [Kamptonema sp. UHCC 0994]MDF0553661.1 DUF4335 domain-containing protein [Kamptonema sp. UHCC 0994]